MEHLETLLTRLEVSQPEGELVAGFRNLGELSFPNWLNTFCLKLGRKWDPGAFPSLDRLQRELVESKSMEIVEAAKSSSLSRAVSKDWVVYQIDLPIQTAHDLPSDFIYRPTKKARTRRQMNYTKQARFKLKSPWHYVSVPSNLIGGLQARQEMQSELEEVRAGLMENYGERSVSTAFNALVRSSFVYNGSNSGEISESLEAKRVKRVSPDLIDRMIEVQKRLIEANTILGDDGRISYNPLTKKNVKNMLKLNARNWDFLQQGRMMTAAELFSEPTFFLDIEIPGFRTPNPQISWIGSCSISPQETRYAIDTIHNLGISELGDFQISSHMSESELIDVLRRRIHMLNPITISAHNAKFDLTKLRESKSGFPIGEEETAPLYKVTTPFFERIGVRDRLVLDTMRWYKIAHAYDFNAKLSMMTGEEKSISYDEMEILEGGTLEDKLRIASYLTDDIRGPVKKVLASTAFQKNVEDVLFIAGQFNVSPERLLHSPGCINEAQERVYFQELGIHREEIPPNQRTTNMQKIREKARASFSRRVVQKGIKDEGQQGLFSDVFKVYIPVGNILRDLVAHRFPQARELYDYRDQHTDDKQRLFFIEQYSQALSKWLIEGYGEILIEAESIAALKGTLSYEKLERAYEDIKSRANSGDRKALSCGKLSLSGLERALSPQVAELVRKRGLDNKGFANLLNSFSRMGRVERRFIGNFDVFPSRDSLSRRGENRENALIVSDTLRKEFASINNFLSENKMKLIAQEGSYLYLTGEKAPLLDRDCPLVLVDEIPRLYSSDNPYYKKNGFYSHLRLSDDPTYHLSCFEMGHLEPLLDRLLAGNFDGAKNMYAKARNTLERGDICPRDMLFRNKSANRYFIFSKLPGKKMYFVESESAIPEDAEILMEEGRRYFQDTERNQRVYIASASEAAEYIDRQIYFDKFAKRGRAMLGPALKKRRRERFDLRQEVLGF